MFNSSGRGGGRDCPWLRCAHGWSGGKLLLPGAMVILIEHLPSLFTTSVEAWSVRASFSRSSNLHMAIWLFEFRGEKTRDWPPATALCNQMIQPTHVLHYSVFCLRLSSLFQSPVVRSLGLHSCSYFEALLDVTPGTELSSLVNHVGDHLVQIALSRHGTSAPADSPPFPHPHPLPRAVSVPSSFRF